MADNGTAGLVRHLRGSMAPDPAPARVAAGVAVVVDMIVVYAVVRTALVAVGHPDERLTHAVLPAVFAGMFAFLGSLGGSVRSGLLRAVFFAAVSLPLTLLAVAVRDLPVAAGVALAAAAAGAGFLAWHGEPWAGLGTLGLYIYFVPFCFGAGSGVAVKYLLVSWLAMAVTTVALRAVVAAVPHRHAPPRPQVANLDQSGAAPVTPTRRFALVPQPELGRLHRTTLRSAIGLGLGAFAVSVTGHHNEVWVLMTLIALVPPAVPLTINRVLQRLAGTAVAMVVLTVIAALVPAGPLRLVALLPGIALTVAYVKRSYFISVLGITTAAVLGYAQVSAPLTEALLWRGLDTLVGAALAIALTLLIPVGQRPQPVWTSAPPPASSTG